MPDITTLSLSSPHFSYQTDIRVPNKISPKKKVKAFHSQEKAFDDCQGKLKQL